MPGAGHDLALFRAALSATALEALDTTTGVDQLLA